MVRGKTVPDWTHVINTISENEERHKLIAKLAMDLPGEKFMILGNRDVQSIAVHKILQDHKEDAHLFIKQEKYRDCRILVAGMKKAGVGFNDPKLTALILATDCTQVQQYEGRIRTSDNIIYDLVDHYGPFENHWKEREEWYRKRGATIKTISLRYKESERRRLAPNR
jgi:predicted phosphohydrolase